MPNTPAVPAPSQEELAAAAADLHMHIAPADLARYGALMQGLVDDFNYVAATPAPRLPVAYPRGAVHQPAAADNPYNAWTYQCTIAGAANGPLKGKRVVIKDNIGVAGVPMLNGSAVYEGFVPDEDATVVNRVLAAGGTILGKATCENFCFSGGSHTSATGPVRNPHNPDFMTGGSSSGCAALLVAGEVDLAIGSDQGGSVRMPASFSGCVGIKPSYGLVPYTGAGPIEQSCDHLGPMAMSSADCALLLEVIAGYDDGRDPRQVARLDAKPYVAALGEGVRGLKIGILEEGFGTPGAEADVDAMVRAAGLRLRDAGAVVEEVSVPMHAVGGRIMITSILDGTLSTYTDLGPLGPNPKGYSLLEAIRFYYTAQRERADLMPVTVKTVLLCAQIMRKRYGPYYSAKAQNLVRELRAAYDCAFADYDLLVMPTTPMKAHRIPPADAPMEVVMGAALDMTGNTSPFDVTGHPALSTPAGMSDGLPVGLMLVGRYGEDDVVLRAGHAFETL
ncbi:MAG: amidase [Gammaproteobacteria bacterium]